MEILLGLKCDRCGREFDVPPDSSTVQCPGCGSWVSTAARGLGPVSSDTTSVQLSSDSKRILKVSHQWDYDYVGEYHTVKGSQYLNLYYEQTIGMYIVTFRGGNPNEGRHWDRSSAPEVRCSDYRDALRAYLKFAERYASSDVASKVENTSPAN
jgi:DNA-directed RNA polymerase subunit RPC12/RpoP